MSLVKPSFNCTTKALNEVIAKHFVVKGVVQGVGFRPALMHWANTCGLKGTFKNSGGVVEAFLEGEKTALEQFEKGFFANSPKMARIDSISAEDAVVQGFGDLIVIPSTNGDKKNAVITPDMAICDDCRAEISSPDDQRFAYPFTSCTNCGPRYTIVENLPYDRANTTMQKFPLCESCENEYVDAQNRRFYAETTACPACGPHLALLNSHGETIAQENEIALKIAAQAIKKGEIIAMLGLGGFQLLCDATNDAAIAKLRQRKQRPHQPFAIMARNMAAVTKVSDLSPAEEVVLTSPAAPIVLLQKSKNNSILSSQIAPETNRIGIMLPTTPLHTLLFSCGENMPDYLIATSGNLHSSPICRTTQQALNHLSNIADFFLTHNREVRRVCDDSVVAINGDITQTWRIGRGLAPANFKAPHKFKSPVLALGADLKNTIAIGTEDRIILSPHNGNLHNLDTLAHFKNMLSDFPNLYDLSPSVIAVDKHPTYESSAAATELAASLKIPVIKVQHHHAHAVAAMAENELEQALCLIFDGTGYGEDGNLWGGELFYVNMQTCDEYKRLAHLQNAILIGGEAAVKQPIRQAVWHLLKSDYTDEQIAQVTNQEKSKIATFRQMVQKGVNIQHTSSCGRLFDAAAAVIDSNLPAEITYEGQAAIRLQNLAQQLATPQNCKPYQYSKQLINDKLQICCSDIFPQILKEQGAGASACQMAYRFHVTVAHMAKDMLLHAQKSVNTKNVALSGGVFQNQLLCRILKDLIQNQGFIVFEHKNCPQGDGGISLGQAVIANKSINKSKKIT